MRNVRGKVAAVALAATVLASSLSCSLAFAATDTSTEQENLVVHTDWNFKLYNDFSKFPSGYNLVKDTDYTTVDDMTMKPVEANGYQSSTAITAKINTNASQDFTILPADGKGFKSDFTGAKEFWVWVDFSNVTFRKMFFGFTDTDGNTYQTDDMDGFSNLPFYVEDGNGGWTEKEFDTDGCIEFGNYKGFIRFSTDLFVCGTTDRKPMDLSKIKGFKVWYDLPGSDNPTTDVSFTIDQIGFAGPSLTDSDGKLGDFAGNGSLVLPSTLPTQTFDETNIKSRFGVLSDIHISSDSGDANDKFASALQQLKAQAGGNLDAVLAVGDVTDYGKPEQAAAVAKVAKANLDLTKTQFIPICGNHEIYNSELGGATWIGNNLFNDAFGGNLYPGATADEIAAGNYHTTINGYDYIGVNCMQYDGGVQYRQEDVDWLKAELQAANTANPGKPIYVFSHPMITGTNWGSNFSSFYSGSDLYSVLKDYPQVIYFAGHLHFPINDERDIWQGDFTTVGTGSCYYCSLEDQAFGMQYYDISGGNPSDCMQYSQGLYVEIDANNNTRITRMDFYNKATIKESWVIPAPDANKTFLKYYTNNRSLENNGPSFDATATVKKDSIDTTKNTMTFEFNKATDDDMVYNYLVSFVDNTTGKTVKSVLMYSDFYRHANPADMSAVVQKTFSAGTLAPFTTDYPNDYYIQVEAIDSYGVKSAAIKSEVYKGTPVDPTKPNEPVGLNVYPNWDFKLFNNFDSYDLGYQMQPNVDYNSWPAPGQSNADTPQPIAADGYNGSKGITTKINSTDNSFIIYIPTEGKGYKSDFSGAKEVWAWVDFSQVKFRKMFFGFRTDNAYGKDYQTDDCDNMAGMTAYIQDGNGGWKAVAFDNDGCLPGFGNYKGFIRIPLDYFRNGTDTLYPDNIQALKVWVSPDQSDPSVSYIGKTYTVDYVGFAGPSMTGADGKVQDVLNNSMPTATEPSTTATLSSTTATESSTTTSAAATSATVTTASTTVASTSTSASITTTAGSTATTTGASATTTAPTKETAVTTTAANTGTTVSAVPSNSASTSENATSASESGTVSTNSTSPNTGENVTMVSVLILMAASAGTFVLTKKKKN